MEQLRRQSVRASGRQKNNNALDSVREMLSHSSTMPREHVIIECTEARAEGKPVSRYMTTRNKKLQTEKVQKKKYNPFLRRHTLHKEIKS
jgi:large subunit ribosomal protein L33